jgi:RHS repeat-associated protein
VLRELVLSKRSLKEKGMKRSIKRLSIVLGLVVSFSALVVVCHGGGSAQVNSRLGDEVRGVEVQAQLSQAALGDRMKEGTFLSGEKKREVRPVMFSRGEAEKEEWEGERTVKQVVKESEGGVIRLGKVELRLPVGSVKGEVEISIEVLEETEALGPGMCNVTGQAHGYRFGPHGMRFEKEIELSLPYDKRLVVGEYELENLYTYFYSEGSKKWEKLKRIGIDREAGVVVSLTDHFTDLINSTLQIPETPGTLSFNPNAIKEIKAADPNSGISQIEGLEGGAFGVASFRIPLSLPAGRGGVMPQLALEYSSEASNGLVGVGFSLSVPEISIDTRFGVPRYNGNDRYVLNGMELVAVGESGGGMRYKQRVEGSFLRIIRYGANARQYWFEVTDKMGVTYIYGTGTCVMGNADKGIYKWYVSRVIDSNGNCVDYRYETEDGYTYIKEIRYTGYTEDRSAGAALEEQGAYRVGFEYEGRPDRIVDCRGRFYTRLGRRLHAVNIYYQNVRVRSYGFEYRDGGNIFGKSELARFVEYGYDGTGGGQEKFYDYSFEYFGMEEEGEGVSGFAEPVAYTKSREMRLEETHSIGGGGGVYVGAGIFGSFNLSLGGEIGVGYDKSFSKWVFMDVNGDGLSDMVHQDGNGRPLEVYINERGEYFSDSKSDFNGFPGTIGENDQWTFNYGVKAGVWDIGVNYGGAISDSDAKMGFTDMDGDGFVDIVTPNNGEGYYRNLGQGGKEFELAPWQVAVSTSINSGAGGDKGGEMAKVENAFHLTDPVIRWKPFRRGKIRIKNNIDKERGEGDGVRINIYRNNASLIQGMVHGPEFAELPYASESWFVKESGSYKPEDIVVEGVTQDDAIYFKANSIHGIAGDGLDWDIEISYENIAMFEDLGVYDCWYLPPHITSSQYLELRNARNGIAQAAIAALYTYDFTQNVYGLNAGAWGGLSVGERNNVRVALFDRNFLLPKRLEVNVYESIQNALPEEARSVYKRHRYRDYYELGSASAEVKEILFSFVRNCVSRYKGFEYNGSRYPVLVDGDGKYYLEFGNGCVVNNSITEADPSGDEPGSNTDKGVLVEVVKRYPEGEVRRYIRKEEGELVLETIGDGPARVERIIDIAGCSVNHVSNSWVVRMENERYIKTYMIQGVSGQQAEQEGSLPQSIYYSMYVPLYEGELSQGFSEGIFERRIAGSVSQADEDFLRSVYELDAGNYRLAEGVSFADKARVLDILTGLMEVVSHYRLNGQQFELKIARAIPVAEYVGLHRGELEAPMNDGEYQKIVQGLADSEDFSEEDEELFGSAYTYDEGTNSWIFNSGLSVLDKKRVLEILIYFNYLQEKELINTRYSYNDGKQEWDLRVGINPVAEVWDRLGGLVYGNMVQRTIRIYDSGVYEVSREDRSGVSEALVVNAALEQGGSVGVTSYILSEIFTSGGYTEERPIYIHVFKSGDDFAITDLIVEEPLAEIDMQGMSDAQKQALYKQYYQEYMAKREVFNGGVYSWFYGEWNGNYKWDEGLLHTLAPNDAAYTYVGEMIGLPIGGVDIEMQEEGVSQEVHVENRWNRECWRGTETTYVEREVQGDGSVLNVERYFASIICKELVQPSRIGGDSAQHIPGQEGPEVVGGIGKVRKGYSTNSSASGSLSEGGFGGSISCSWGWSAGEKDLIDLNGDRYPDRISFNANSSKIEVMYNLGGGGFEEKKLVLGSNLFSCLRRSENVVYGAGVMMGPGGSPMIIKVDPSGKVTTAGPEKSSQDPLKGIGGGLNASLGVATTTVDMIDINGDGLPDHVSRNGGSYQVKLNTGDGFIDAPAWGFSDGDSADEDAIQYGGFNCAGGNLLKKETDVIQYSNTVSGDASISAGLYYFGVNGSVELNGNRVKAAFVDINGDGLPDRVFKKHSDPYFIVRFNTGDGFAAPVRWYTADWGPEVNINGHMLGQIADMVGDLTNRNGEGSADFSKINTSSMESNLNGLLNGIDSDLLNDMNLWGAGDVIGYDGGFKVSVGANVTFMFGPFWIFGVYLTPSGYFHYGISGAKVEMDDINGDGLPDHVFCKDDGDEIYVKYNKARKVGLLRRITTPAGGAIMLNYERSVNSVRNPHSLWVLSEVQKTDGMSRVGEEESEYLTRYSYEDDLYDRMERTFLGFGRVITTYADGSKKIDYYHNNSVYDKGICYRTERVDEHDEPFTVQTFDYVEIPDGKSERIRWPQLTRKRSYIYDGSGSGECLETGMDYTSYDEYGNIREAIDVGDVNTNEDDIHILIEYEDFAEERYLVAKPNLLEVSKASGELLRKRSASYYEDGNLRELTQWLSNNSFENPRSAFTYTKYGSIASVVDPMGYTLEYTYDEAVHTYVTEVKDTFHYSSNAKYDYRLGKDIEDTDINGNVMRKEYDKFGRPKKVWSPYDNYPLGMPSIEFEYLRDNFPYCALTKNKISFNPAQLKTIDTLIIIDGMGRVLQSKKTTEVYDSEANAKQEGMSISGRIVYDEMGRVWREGQAGFEEGNALSYQGPIDLGYYTEYEYDILARQTEMKVQHLNEQGVLESHSMTTEYLVEDNLSKVIVTDLEGNREESWADCRENIVRIIRYNNEGAQEIATRYRYSVLNELEEITDAKGNITSMAYDNLGRKTDIRSADRGWIHYEYNKGGNIILKLDDNLREKAHGIIYHYDYNRLREIEYPEKAHVLYEYGAYTAVNNARGRLVKVTDESGTSEYSYGRLGEVIRIDQEIICITPNSSLNFSFRYGYNNLGQMEWIEYPDGERVSYEYDKGGLVFRVTGIKGAAQFGYVNDIGYDKFGQRVFIEYGNGSGGRGVRTYYTYRPDRRWLERVNTVNANGVVFQDMRYEFDLVGNIKRVSKQGELGTVSQEYEYDDLYQLTHAQGEYVTHRNGYEERSTYNQSFNFDELGNILGKVSHYAKSPGTGGQGFLNYTYTYTYNELKAQRIKTINEWSFEYDGNGNIIRQVIGDVAGGGGGAVPLAEPPEFKDPDIGSAPGACDLYWNDDEGNDNGIIASYVWDEDNRLKQSTARNKIVQYRYDANGERTVKASADGETVYVQKMYQVENLISPRLYTKHIFVGSERLISKMHYENGSIGFERENVYCYHTDHLGSTNVVSTQHDGEIFEYMEYTPYGELWVEQTKDSENRLNYTFTGKERDRESGFYYYGARYLDPKISRWMSPDPAWELLIDPKSDDYSVIEGTAWYVYCSNNPLKYVDPTGFVYRSNNTIWLERLRKREKQDFQFINQQGNTCLLHSLRNLIYEKTGKAVSIETLMEDFVSETGLGQYPSGGWDMDAYRDTPIKVLEKYGISAELCFMQKDDIIEAVKEGPLIVGINGNHMVVMTGLVNGEMPFPTIADPKVAGGRQMNFKGETTYTGLSLIITDSNFKDQYSYIPADKTIKQYRLDGWVIIPRGLRL